MIRRHFKNMGVFVLLLAINLCLALSLASRVIIPVIITIEARDEKNQDSYASEIWIESIEVDGKKQENLKIESGKWVWKGDLIGWRNYSQPENITPEVNFKLPAGRSYNIVFESNQYRGIANISVGDESIAVDCYSSNLDSGATTTQRIEPSNIDSYILQTVVRMACVAFVVIVLFLLEMWIGESKALKALPRKEMIWYIIAPIAFGAVVFSTADYTLWGDEMLQLASVFNTASLSDVVESCLYMVDATPPLFTVLAWSWIKIAPFGEQWIRLLPIVLTMCSIVVTGYLARVLYGQRVGIIALFCAGFSSTLAVFASHQFRAYALYILFTTITVLCFFLKFKWKKAYLIFGVSMAALLYTQYYGLLVCGILFLWDLYLYCRRKQGLPVTIAPYVIAGLAFLPWVIQVLTNLTERPQFWAAHPTIWSFGGLLYYLCSYQEFAVILLVISTVAAVWSMRSKGFFVCTRENLKNAVLLSLLMGIPLLSYIADMVLGGDAGIFGERYFINLIPIVVIFISKVLSDVGTDIFKLINTSGYEKPLVVAMILIGFISFGSDVKNNLIYQNQTYRQAVNEIMIYNDIYEGDSAIVIGSWDPQNKHLSLSTAVEYYATRKGERDAPIIYDSYELDEEKIKGVTTIYVIDLPGDVTSMLRELLDTEYTVEYKSNLGYSRYVKI